MAKKRPKPEKRTDAERRARQSERLSRHLRVLQCIMGSGRWDAEALSQELEVSPRTIHRIMQTLAMANVPWYFCKDNECYRVREGFRFPGFEPGLKKGKASGDPNEVLAIARKVLSDSERLVDSLRLFCRILETGASGAES
jgi:hypothetical protein